MRTLPDHQDSVEPQSAFVAYFDVLGFQSRLQHQSLRNILSQYRYLIQRKKESARVPVFSSGGSAVHEVGETIYSDSILYWCNDDWESVQTLISASAYLIADTIDIGWPLRGGLAYGECVLDRDTRTFIGQPIIDAYVTEQSQCWIGASLHSSISQHLILGTKIVKLGDIIEYDVPTKRCCPSLRHAIHWGPYSARARVSLEEMRSASTKRKIRRYYKTTLDYITNRCRGFHAATK